MEPQPAEDIGATLRAALEGQTQSFLQEAFFNACRDRTLSPNAFNAFALQRFGGGAALLEGLLATGTSLAQKSGLTPLKTALAHNLADELGIQGDFSLAPAGAHANMRQHFLSQLIPAQPSPYEAYIRKLQKTKNLPEIVGAILWLEYSIPEEFKIYRDYLTATRPDMAGNPRAMRYPNDHISHDAKRHFPELFEVVMASNLDLAPLLAGIRNMCKTRTQSYYRPPGL